MSDNEDNNENQDEPTIINGSAHVNLELGQKVDDALKQQVVEALREAGIVVKETDEEDEDE